MPSWPRRLVDGDLVLIRGELGSGQDDARAGRGPGAGRRGPRDQPHLQHRPPLPGRGLTVSHLDLYRLAGLEGEDPDLLADYLGPGRIAFVEWPQQGEAELPARGCGHPRHAGRRPPAHRDRGARARRGARGDPARLRHGDRRDGRRAAAGRRHHARSTRRPAAGSPPGPRDAAPGDGRRAARRGRARAGASSSGWRSASGPGPSRACGSGSPPPAASPSRSASSSPAVSSLDALARGAAGGGAEAQCSRRSTPAAARSSRRPTHAGRASWPARRALAPGEIRGVLQRPGVAGGAPWLGVGDGAVRYREELERAGVEVPAGRLAAAPAARRGRLRAGARRAASPGTPRCFPTTCAGPTPSWRSRAQAGRRSDERALDHRPPRPRLQPADPDPPAQLPRPAPGDRDRAARLPDALVAGDVRARALQAVGDLPGGGRRRSRRPARRLPDLLPLRHRLAHHEHRRRPGTSAGGWPRRCWPSSTGGSTTPRRASRWRSAARTPSRSTSTSGKASARPGCGGATTRTTARTPW